MFEYLGLTEAIHRVAFFPPGLGMNDVRTGEKVVRVPLGETALAAYGYPYGVIYRADLHQVFLDACKALPNITLRTASKVESFEQDAAGVRVQLAGGEVVRGDALIGADGLWSRIREAVVGDGKPRVSGHIAYRAVLKREDVPAHLWSDDVLLWGGEKTHLVHYPLRRGELFNLVAVFHSNKYDEGWNTFGDTAELNERFAHAVPQVRELLDKIETWKMWVLCDREPVKNWTDRRVTLLGDAAHPCCSTWRKARARRSRMRSCWARPCASPAATSRRHFRSTSRRATCAPAACSSLRASTATSTMRPACSASCATRCSRAARNPRASPA